MEKIIELTLKVSLTPNVDMAKLAAYSPVLAKNVSVIFEEAAKEMALDPAHVESNVTMDVADALIEWHKAMVKRFGSEALVDVEHDVIVPAAKEAFDQACDMVIKDAIYADPDAKPEVVHDYRKGDVASIAVVVEGARV